MIHEHRNPQSLFVTAEFIDPATGMGVSSTLINPSMTIYNIKHGMYWCAYEPSTGMALTNDLNNSGSYSGGGGGWTNAPWNLSNRNAYEVTLAPIVGTGAGSPGRFISNALTTFHAQIMDGTAGVASTVNLADYFPGDPGPMEGYLIEISDTSGATFGLPITGVPGSPHVWSIHITCGPMGVVDANLVSCNAFPISTSPVNNNLRVDVFEWASEGVSNTGAAPNIYPNVNVSTYAGSTASISTAGLPNVNVESLLDDLNSAANLQHFSDTGYSSADSSVVRVENVASLNAGAIISTSFDANSITSNAIAGGAIHAGVAGTKSPALEAGAIHPGGTAPDGTAYDPAIAGGAIHPGNSMGLDPAIADDAIHNAALADEAIHADTIKSGAIHAGDPATGVGPAIADDAIHDAALANDAIHADTIKGGAIHAGDPATGVGPAIADNAIHDAALAENAINEKAIQIDSVTYEELSDSAMREIARAVWQSSIFSPIDESRDGTGTYDFSGIDMTMAKSGTMGHAMLVDHLSKYMVHTSASPDGSGNFWSTPMHFTLTDDPTGEKFYSVCLAETPLLSTGEIESYIDRTAVLYRGMSLLSGDTTHTVKFVLRLQDTDSDGWEGAEFNLYRTSDGSLIRHIALTAADVTPPYSNVRLLDMNLEPNTEYNWEIIHGTDPDPVIVSAWVTDNATDLWEMKIAENITGLGPTVGSFTTGELQARMHQQHLVRITEVGTDAGGQFFRIKRVDEDGSPIPGGIKATKRDPSKALIDGWDEVRSRSGDILIVKAETDATMHEVAHEVWEESVHDHATPDTFGMLNRIMAGLSQYNHQITDSAYDESGRLIACRLVVYPSSEDARNGENALTTIEVSSTYDEKQNMTTFVAAEEKSE